MHTASPLKIKKTHKPRHAKQLDGRGDPLLKISIGDPSAPLIELPVDLPTIPIVGPLLAPLITPIIDGPHQTATVQPTTQAPTSTQLPTPVTPIPANPAPTPTAGGGENNSNGGGNAGNGGSNSNAGGNGGNSGSSSNVGGNGGNGDSGSNTGSLPGNGTPNNGGSSGNSNGSPTNGNPSGSGNTEEGSGAAIGNTSPNSGSPPHPPSNPPSTDDDDSSSVRISPTSGTNAHGGSSQSSSASSAGVDSVTATVSPSFQPAINVQHAPAITDGAQSPTATNAQSAVDSQSTSGSTTASHGNSGTSPGSSGGNPGSGGDDPGSSPGSLGGGGHHGLSKGAIAAIAVVGALLLIALLVLILRKCSQSRRTARRRDWFRRGTKYGATAISSEQYFAEKRQSHRSSFGTTVDYGRSATPATNEPFNVVWPPSAASHPQMSGRSSTTYPMTVTIPPTAPTSDRAASPLIRTSITDSNESFHSSPQESMRSGSQLSQYLQVPQTAPVRDGGLSPEWPAVSPMSVRPFSPTETWSFPTPPKDLRRQSQNALSSQTSLVTTKRVSMETSESFHSAPENPFADFATADTHISVDSTSNPQEDHTLDTASVEIVRRPFVPTLHDEMPVKPGDEVRVLASYDDGWALAENVNNGQQGLFPIDCLRMPHEDLPAFLAAKRLSSYAASVSTAKHSDIGIAR